MCTHACRQKLDGWTDGQTDGGREKGTEEGREEGREGGREGMVHVLFGETSFVRTIIITLVTRISED